MEDNLKDFTTNWIVFGLLFVCLISFAISFMWNNNPGGFGDGTDEIFGQIESDISGRLLATPDDADIALNITANTNPELGDLGSRDSVATSYSIMGMGRKIWESTKFFIGWIFFGEMGKMLLAVFGGLISIASVYFITKWIRNGI